MISPPAQAPAHTGVANEVMTAASSFNPSDWIVALMVCGMYVMFLFVSFTSVGECVGTE